MERDDIVEYSLYNHHTEEDGKKLRKKIIKITFILSLITIAEIIFGIVYPKSHHGNDWFWFYVKCGYIVLTLIKAAYIVLSFMHLGDERKAFKLFILIPYALFIVYLTFLLLFEAYAIHDIWLTYFN